MILPTPIGIYVHVGQAVPDPAYVAVPMDVNSALTVVCS